MPSTTSLFSSGRTRSTRPVVRALPVPASSPVITSTMSSLRMCTAGSLSNHLGGQADDLHEVALAQLAGHRAKDARAARVLLVVDQHQRVAVEAHVTAVLPARGPL